MGGGVPDRGLVLVETGVVPGFSCVVSGIKAASGCDQARDWASRVFLTITRLAKAKQSVQLREVFFLRPR